MDLSLNAEQEALQESFRRLFSKECPTSLVRDLQANPDGDHISSLWSSLAEVGLFGLALPEDFGGYGSLFDLGLAFMEAGRVLCPTPVYSTVAFGQALHRFGSAAQKQQWLPGVAAGAMVGSVALSNPSDASDVSPRLIARYEDGGWRLSGALEFVANADLASAVVISAQVDAAEPPTTLVCIVDGDHPDCRIERMQTFGRDVQCVMTFDGVAVDPARLIYVEPAERLSGELHAFSNAMTALQAMERIGGAQAVLDRTVEYVIGRTQFDRPLASFQAVQHHVANMHIAIEGARLAAYQAAWLTSQGRLAEREVALAKQRCGEAYKFATLTAHQLHGGMGYMREFDLHLWSERAKASELLGGPAAVQSRRLERAMSLVG